MVETQQPAYVGLQRTQERDEHGSNLPPFEISDLAQQEIDQFLGESNEDLQDPESVSAPSNAHRPA